MDVNGLIAFLGGGGSFFSPCVLPVVPSFLIYISGVTIHAYSELAEPRYRRRMLLHAIAFITGFSLVFIALGCRRHSWGTSSPPIRTGSWAWAGSFSS
jgi:cytochrome c-type biogenesis protein